MKRYAETSRFLLLAAASRGDLGYHLKIMQDAGLINDEGITEKGLAILEPLRDEEMYLRMKERVKEVGLEPEILLMPDLAFSLVRNLRDLPSEIEESTP